MVKLCGNAGWGGGQRSGGMRVWCTVLLFLCGFCSKTGGDSMETTIFVTSNVTVAVTEDWSTKKIPSRIVASSTSSPQEGFLSPTTPLDQVSRITSQPEDVSTLYEIVASSTGIFTEPYISTLYEDPEPGDILATSTGAVTEQYTTTLFENLDDTMSVDTVASEQIVSSSASFDNPLTRSHSTLESTLQPSYLVISQRTDFITEWSTDSSQDSLETHLPESARTKTLVPSALFPSLPLRTILPSPVTLQQSTIVPATAHSMLYSTVVELIASDMAVTDDQLRSSRAVDSVLLSSPPTFQSVGSFDSLSLPTTVYETVTINTDIVYSTLIQSPSLLQSPGSTLYPEITTQFPPSSSCAPSCTCTSPPPSLPSPLRSRIGSSVKAPTVTPSPYYQSDSIPHRETEKLETLIYTSYFVETTEFLDPSSFIVPTDSRPVYTYPTRTPDFTHQKTLSDITTSPETMFSSVYGTQTSDVFISVTPTMEPSDSLTYSEKLETLIYTSYFVETSEFLDPSSYIVQTDSRPVYTYPTMTPEFTYPMTLSDKTTSSVYGTQTSDVLISLTPAMGPSDSLIYSEKLETLIYTSYFVETSEFLDPSSYIVPTGSRPVYTYPTKTPEFTDPMTLSDKTTSPETMFSSVYGTQTSDVLISVTPTMEPSDSLTYSEKLETLIYTSYFVETSEFLDPSSYIVPTDSRPVYTYPTMTPEFTYPMTLSDKTTSSVYGTQTSDVLISLTPAMGPSDSLIYSEKLETLIYTSYFVETSEFLDPSSYIVPTDSRPVYTYPTRTPEFTYPMTLSDKTTSSVYGTQTSDVLISLTPAMGPSDSLIYSEKLETLIYTSYFVETSEFLDPSSYIVPTDSRPVYTYPTRTPEFTYPMTLSDKTTSPETLFSSVYGTQTSDVLISLIPSMEPSYFLTYSDSSKYTDILDVSQVMSTKSDVPWTDISEIITTEVYEYITTELYDSGIPGTSTEEYQVSTIFPTLSKPSLHTDSTLQLTVSEEMPSLSSVVMETTVLPIDTSVDSYEMSSVLYTSLEMSTVMPIIPSMHSVHPTYDSTVMFSSEVGITHFESFTQSVLFSTVVDVTTILLSDTITDATSIFPTTSDYYPPPSTPSLSSSLLPSLPTFPPMLPSYTQTPSLDVSSVLVYTTLALESPFSSRSTEDLTPLVTVASDTVSHLSSLHLPSDFLTETLSSSDMVTIDTTDTFPMTISSTGDYLTLFMSMTDTIELTSDTGTLGTVLTKVIESSTSETPLLLTPIESLQISSLDTFMYTTMLDTFISITVVTPSTAVLEYSSSVLATSMDYTLSSEIPEVSTSEIYGTMSIETTDFASNIVPTFITRNIWTLSQDIIPSRSTVGVATSIEPTVETSFGSSIFLETLSIVTLTSEVEETVSQTTSTIMPIISSLDTYSSPIFPGSYSSVISQLLTTVIPAQTTDYVISTMIGPTTSVSETHILTDEVTPKVVSSTYAAIESSGVTSQVVTDTISFGSLVVSSDHPTLTAIMPSPSDILKMTSSSFLATLSGTPPLTSMPPSGLMSQVVTDTVSLVVSSDPPTPTALIPSPSDSLEIASSGFLATLSGTPPLTSMPPSGLMSQVITDTVSLVVSSDPPTLTAIMPSPSDILKMTSSSFLATLSGTPPLTSMPPSGLMSQVVTDTVSLVVSSDPPTPTALIPSSSDSLEIASSGFLATLSGTPPLTSMPPSGLMSQVITDTVSLVVSSDPPTPTALIPSPSDSLEIASSGFLATLSGTPPLTSMLSFTTSTLLHSVRSSPALLSELTPAFAAQSSMSELFLSSSMALQSTTSMIMPTASQMVTPITLPTLPPVTSTTESPIDVPEQFQLTMYIKVPTSEDITAEEFSENLSNNLEVLYIEGGENDIVQRRRRSNSEADTLLGDPVDQEWIFTRKRNSDENSRTTKHLELLEQYVLNKEPQFEALAKESSAEMEWMFVSKQIGRTNPEIQVRTGGKVRKKRQADPSGEIEVPILTLSRADDTNPETVTVTFYVMENDSLVLATDSAATYSTLTEGEMSAQLGYAVTSMPQPVIPTPTVTPDYPFTIPPADQINWLKVTMLVDTAFDETNATFQKQLRNDLEFLYVNGSDASDGNIARTRRDLGRGYLGDYVILEAALVRGRRAADPSSVTEVALESVDRPEAVAEDVNVVFYVVDEGTVIPGATALVPYQQFSLQELQDVTGYEVVSPGVTLFLTATPTGLAWWWYLLIALIALLLTIVIFLIIYYYCWAKKTAIKTLNKVDRSTSVEMGFLPLEKEPKTRLVVMETALNEKASKRSGSASHAADQERLTDEAAQKRKKKKRSKRAQESAREYTKRGYLSGEDDQLFSHVDTHSTKQKTKNPTSTSRLQNNAVYPEPERLPPLRHRPLVAYSETESEISNEQLRMMRKAGMPKSWYTTHIDKDPEELMKDIAREKKRRKRKQEKKLQDQLTAEQMQKEFDAVLGGLDEQGIKNPTARQLQVTRTDRWKPKDTKRKSEIPDSTGVIDESAVRLIRTRPLESAAPPATDHEAIKKEIEDLLKRGPPKPVQGPFSMTTSVSQEEAKELAEKKEREVKLRRKWAEERKRINRILDEAFALSSTSLGSPSDQSKGGAPTTSNGQSSSRGKEFNKDLEDSGYLRHRGYYDYDTLDDSFLPGMIPGRIAMSTRSIPLYETSFGLDLTGEHLYDPIRRPPIEYEFLPSQMRSDGSAPAYGVSVSPVRTQRAPRVSPYPPRDFQGTDPYRSLNSSLSSSLQPMQITPRNHHMDGTTGIGHQQPASGRNDEGQDILRVQEENLSLQRLVAKQQRELDHALALIGQPNSRIGQSEKSENKEGKVGSNGRKQRRVVPVNSAKPLNGPSTVSAWTDDHKAVERTSHPMTSTPNKDNMIKVKPRPSQNEGSVVLEHHIEKPGKGSTNGKDRTLHS